MASANPRVPAWVELFDLAYLESTCETLRAAVAENEGRLPLALARTVERLLCAPLRTYVAEHGKPREPNNVTAARGLLAVCNKLHFGITYSDPAVTRAAVGAINGAWKDFVLHGSAACIYHDVPATAKFRASRSAKGNEQKQKKLAARNAAIRAGFGELCSALKSYEKQDLGKLLKECSVPQANWQTFKRSKIAAALAKKHELTATQIRAILKAPKEP